MKNHLPTHLKNLLSHRNASPTWLNEGVGGGRDMVKIYTSEYILNLRPNLKNLNWNSEPPKTGFNWSPAQISKHRIQFDVEPTMFFEFGLCSLYNVYVKAFNDVVLSRRAIHNMNTLYPDATAQELENTDNVCIICRLVNL